MMFIHQLVNIIPQTQSRLFKLSLLLLAYLMMFIQQLVNIIPLTPSRLFKLLLLLLAIRYHDVYSATSKYILLTQSRFFK